MKIAMGRRIGGENAGMREERELVFIYPTRAPIDIDRPTQVGRDLTPTCNAMMYVCMLCMRGIFSHVIRIIN